MRSKKGANRDLPPRMLRRVRALKSGKVWVGYYYDGRDEGGKRKEIPLGTDLNEARVEWARLERTSLPKAACLMGEVFDRYRDAIIPTKAPRTQRDNLKELEILRKAFGEAPIDSITTPIVAQYRDARTAKVRANREIALLSHVFTIAREWGLTEKANPCFGLRRNKEKPRDFYATEGVWNAVYKHAVPELRDAMDLAYLCGQRPADTLKASATDIVGGFLEFRQGKTDKKLRIRLYIGEEPTSLGKFVEGLLERRRIAGIRGTRLITNASGMRMSLPMLTNRWNEAREQAITEAVLQGDQDLAAKIREFRFMDIRPRAASDIEDVGQAAKLLGHSSEKITKQVYRRRGEVVNPTETTD
ncbi:integrase [Pseudomonas sp. 21LCFQ02]|uniref:integrase n=1 Tax=unclassified Pseudomonas TaxID=196821 RepID=UPI00209804EA|nr:MULTISPECIES: integrase [unclassified Pseudomonas]MCO8161020.1 integrase [Pseudomonas sp. 21LCFQ010]MCO8166901.1 integrase [Pseudomonas sp. 21LCFQ02]